MKGFQNALPGLFIYIFNFTAWKGFDNTIQDIQDGDVHTYIAQQDVESYHKVLGMRKAELVWGNPGLQSKQQEG